jgi:hypothetical protein
LGAGLPHLRYLETEAGEVEMARHEAGPARCSFDSALVSVKHRDPVLAELVKGLNDPQLGIDWNYIRSMAFLSLYNQHPEWYPAREVMPKSNYPAQTSALWSLHGVPEAEETRYARMLVSALPAKTGEARRASFETLLGAGRVLNPVPVPPDLIASISSQLPALLPSLSSYPLESVLVDEWELFKSPGMAPALLNLAQKDGSLGLDGIVVRRLFELSPDDGRAVILGLLKAPENTGFRRAEISSAKHFVDNLSLLPDKELPDLDDTMLQRLESSPEGTPRDISAGLLQRYASAGIGGKLQPWFEDRIGKISCDAHASLVAYFLRVDPPTGVALLSRVLQANLPTCPELQRVAGARMSPEVEQAAIAALDNTNTATVVDALGALQGWGSTGSKDAILSHFRAWHAAWAPRASDLVATAGKGQNAVETSYVAALGSAQGWYTSDQEWQGIADLCVTDVCRTTAHNIQHSWNFPPHVYMIEVYGPALRGFPGLQGFMYNITPGNPGPPTIERLKERMAEFPKGDEFRIDDRYREKHVTQKLYDELLPFATAHGFKLAMLGE